MFTLVFIVVSSTKVPPLARHAGFHLSMLHVDFMHSDLLGVGGWLLATAFGSSDLGRQATCTQLFVKISRSHAHERRLGDAVFTPILSSIRQAYKIMCFFNDAFKD